MKNGVFLNFACSLREKAGLVTLRFLKKGERAANLL